MLACVDTFYFDDQGVAGCVVFRDWKDYEPVAEYRAYVSPIEPYVPGQFYRRELPCILAVLDQVTESVDLIIIDGYVWLGGGDHPGLGSYLYEALGKRVPVVGVAKTSFRGAANATKVLRGGSAQPLFVTSVGIEQDEAAERVRLMHGMYRLPTLLKRVDQLSKRIE